MDIKTIGGKVGWVCPSNIALIKYWGKHGRQLPNNPSISFTLTNAHTKTTIHFTPNESEDFRLTFFLDQKINEKFGQRTAAFFNSVAEFFPFIKGFDYVVESTNTFPHSSGIASSASGMGALAMCLCDIERKLTDDNLPIDLTKASFIARLGSGSACRSLFPHMALWGKTPLIADSSDDHAIAYSNFHEVFSTYHDDILIVSAGQKEVSSSAGHGLMDNNPFAPARYDQANQNLEVLLSALQQGDLQTFGEIVETEALTLHALMMCCQPSFMLMLPNSINLIQKVRAFRKDSGLPLYFTLDAGPNLHLLYPDKIATEVNNFINSDLRQYCQNGEVIKDIAGIGPQAIV